MGKPPPDLLNETFSKYLIHNNIHLQIQIPLLKRLHNLNNVNFTAVLVIHFKETVDLSTVTPPHYPIM